MKYVLKNQELGYIVDADERLSFKDDLRSGGLLLCVSQWTIVYTEVKNDHAQMQQIH